MAELAGRIPDRLIVDDQGSIRLLSTRCADCAASTFPTQDSCARCGSENVADVPLPNAGTLWSYTVQTFRPPAPPFAAAKGAEKTFPAFGVGMVEFSNGLCVQGRLTEADRNKLRIGMPVTTVLVRFDPDSEDLIYAFRPVESGARA